MSAAESVRGPFEDGVKDRLDFTKFHADSAEELENELRATEPLEARQDLARLYHPKLVEIDAALAAANNTVIDRQAFAELVEEIQNQGPYEEDANAEIGRFPFINFYDIDYRAAGRGLIKGLIDQGSFVVTYGASNSSKTFLALDVSLCIASGLPWHGRKVTKHPVVYVAAEGGASIQNRIRAYRDFYLKDQENVLFDVIPAPIDLLDRNDDVDALIRDILKLEDKYGQKPGLVVIDTLAQSMSGGEENSSKDMGKAVDSVNRIRRAIGCTVNLVHHSGKNATAGARGWSGLQAATDSEFEVAEVGGGLFKITTTKQRDYALGMPITYTLKVVETTEDEDGEMQTTCVVVPSNIEPLPRKKAPRLNDRAGIFQGCMETLFIAKRDVSIPSEVREAHLAGIPAFRTAVTLADVRELFQARIGDTEECRDSDRDTNRDSWRQYFKRAKDSLIRNEIIDMSGELLWFR